MKLAKLVFKGQICVKFSLERTICISNLFHFHIFQYYNALLNPRRDPRT
jgi:hypothetical protein